MSSSAAETLKELEEKAPRRERMPQKEEDELPMFAPIKDSIIDTLKNINVDTLTPIEALGKLYELSKEAQKF